MSEIRGFSAISRPVFDRPSVRSDLDPAPMPELFPCDLIVVRRAEAADVVVDVFAALGERDDMVGHGGCGHPAFGLAHRSEEHTSELQSLMRISYAVFCLKKNNQTRVQEREQEYMTISHQQ